MPVDAPASPAVADPTSGAPNVSSMAPSQAVQARDARDGNRQSTPDRSKAAREKLNAVAKDMAAKKFLLGDKPVAGDDAKEVVTDDAADAAPEPQADAKAAPAPKKVPTSEEKAATAEKSKKINAAKRALALDGWEAEDIAELEKKSIDKLLQIGGHRAKNQGDVNREFAKLRENSPTGARNSDGTFAKPAEATPAATALATAQQAEPAKPAPKAAAVQTPSGEDDIDAIIDAAEDEIGQPAVKLLKSITSVLTARVKAAEAKAASGGEIGQAVSREMLYSQGREIVEGDFPDQMAADPNAFDEVAENFQALVASGRYGRGQISKVWRDAGRMYFGEPDTVRKAQRNMLARQKAADIGRVDPGAGDTGASTEQPISNGRDALKLAASMFAKNPNGNLDTLKDALMSKVRAKVA